MAEQQTSQQLLQNSYHLSIRSSLLAIQCILSRQETILQSNHYTVADMRSAIAYQNTTLQQITKTLAGTFSKISFYQQPLLPQPRSNMPTQIHAAVPSKQVAPLPPLISYAPPKSTLPFSASPAPENLSLETSHFRPLQSEPANNLQPNHAELHIGDSDQNGEKFQPPDNSGTLLQQSNSSSIEMLDPKDARTLVYSKSTRVHAGVIAGTEPLFNLKAWSSHIETLDGSYEKERKSAFGDARNLFEKMGSETFQSPLEMSINRLETVNNNVPLVYHLAVGTTMQFGCQNPFAWIEQYGHKLFDVMLERDAREIFERTIYIFDPGVFADASTVFAERNKFRGKSKIFIFDPGGTLAVERVSDLEDKVDLEGVGVDTATSDTPVQEEDAHNDTRPLRIIHKPQRYLD